MAQLQFCDATNFFLRKENKSNRIYSTILLPRVTSSAILPEKKTSILVASQNWSRATDVTWTVLPIYYYVSGSGNISVVLLSMEDQRALRFHQKHLNLCRWEDDMKRHEVSCIENRWAHICSSAKNKSFFVHNIWVHTLYIYYIKTHTYSIYLENIYMHIHTVYIIYKYI